MSRLPPPTRGSTRTPLKPPSTPSRAAAARTLTPTTPTTTSRTRTTSTRGRATPTPRKQPEEPPSESKPAMSIKEAIALKRAQAKKATSSTGLGDMGSLEDALPASSHQPEEDDLLGRLPLRETIEKARSTGLLNVAGRELPCLPSGLFEIHLNITPDPLKSVENEPKLPPAEERPAPRRGASRNQPAWFEAQDLTVLKAFNNEITEIQHEISLFGSLKTVDLHKNKLTTLPNTFADLSFLTILDLSHNLLTSLPDNLWSLPELTTLNISHNQLTALPFNAPFRSASKRTGPNSYASTDFFAPAIVRAATPLPKLTSLDASHNKITAEGIDPDIPSSLTKLDLSSNPVGNIASLLQTLGSFPRLKELRFEKAEVSIPPDLFSSFKEPPFPALRILDLSETSVTLSTVEVAFKPLSQELDHSFTVDEPPHGVTRILVGKRVVKEAWEIELEKRAQTRAAKGTGLGSDWDPEPASKPKSPSPRASPAKAASPPPPARATTPTPAPAKKKEVVKEAWEIEAEQGMLTEGGKRRARAAAATREEDKTPSPTTSGSPINNPQYYNAQTQTLTLPASAPAPKAAQHSRSFSLASSFASRTPGAEIALPAPTLPLSLIAAQPFAATLKVLVLTNRRLDRTFAIPGGETVPAAGILPLLEELDLEGCNLDDTVAVHREPDTRTTEPILTIIAKLFPNLRTLNLSYNRITDGALGFDALSGLILQAPHRAGLRALRLRGNKLQDLDGFQKVAELFRGHREVPEWRMEELDLRDNEIGKLHPELGLLPLDVFLVEGNMFRVPQRRVWEREGTKGLLSWLRGRME